MVTQREMSLLKCFLDGALKYQHSVFIQREREPFTHVLGDARFTSVKTPCIRNKTSSCTTGPPLVELRVTTLSQLGIPVFVMVYLKFCSMDTLEVKTSLRVRCAHLVPNHGVDAICTGSGNERLYVRFCFKCEYDICSLHKVAYWHLQCRTVRPWRLPGELQFGDSPCILPLRRQHLARLMGM